MSVSAEFSRMTGKSCDLCCLALQRNDGFQIEQTQSVQGVIHMPAEKLLAQT